MGEWLYMIRKVTCICCLSVTSLIAQTVRYDFAGGDALTDKNGWVFADRVGDIKITTIPGRNISALQFPYSGSTAGNDHWTEQRFTMPPADSCWIQLRLHIPSNYKHRFDVKIDVPADSVANWKTGDIVRGADGTSEGIICGINRDSPASIFLRNPPVPWSNDVWVGAITNVTRNSRVTSSTRAMETSNNKLLALWTDDYSAHGKGPSVVWEMWNGDAPYGQSPVSTTLSVHYSAGNNTGAGPHVSASGEDFILPSDAGKYIDIMTHIAFSSVAQARNGVIQTWVRKESESAWRLCHSITDADMDKRSDVAENLRQWRAGYLMGWSNSGYDDSTVFYISEIAWYGTAPSGLPTAAAQNVRPVHIAVPRLQVIHDKLYVDIPATLPFVSVNLFNAGGKCILSKKLSSTISPSVDLRTLPAGVYIAKAVRGDNRTNDMDVVCIIKR